MLVILASSSVDGVTATATVADEVIVGGESVRRPSNHVVVVVV